MIGKCSYCGNPNAVLNRYTLMCIDAGTCYLYDWESRQIENPVYIQRMDGRIERQCEHGVGHTVKVPRKYEKSKAWWVHGCDGCCEKWSKH